MHEFSIVESLVQGVLEQMKERNITKVVSVRFKRGSAFSEEALRQAFTSLSRGTVLEGAELEIDTVNLDFTCKCGRKQVIKSDDLVGHMFICPDCGAIKEVDEAHDLELVQVVADQP